MQQAQSRGPDRCSLKSQRMLSYSAAAGAGQIQISLLWERGGHVTSIDSSNMEHRATIEQCGGGHAVLWTGGNQSDRKVSQRTSVARERRPICKFHHSLSDPRDVVRSEQHRGLQGRKWSDRAEWT